MSSQQVNLFNVKMIRGPYWLHSRCIVGVCVLILLIELGYSCFLAVDVNNKKNNFADFQLEKTEYSQKKNRLKKEINKRQNELLVVKQHIEKLQENRLNSENISKIIAKDNRFASDGFLPLVESFVYYNEIGISLGEFHLLNGGQQIRLKGNSVEADLVPNYLHNLIKSDYFKSNYVVDSLQLTHMPSGSKEEVSTARGELNEDIRSVGWFAFEADISTITKGEMP